MLNIYLERYATQKTYIDPLNYGHPGIVVVIPCHNEEGLVSSLQSIENCEQPNCKVSVIVMINASEKHDSEIHQRNNDTLTHANEWLNSSEKKYRYHFIIDNHLPRKHAGVGLARKIGMDEAVRMFETNDHDGVILCFDADSLCEINLLVEVERLFSDEKIVGCSIHYEHPLAGDLPDANYVGIIKYESHLRYYIGALKFAGFPYAYQTIGSSMASRSSAYQKQGGMNRRKAGEDFYFLHRIIPLGNFKNLSSTMIIPSPRSSDRVPFGTGKAIGDWLDSDQKDWQTYNPEIFEELKRFISLVDELFDERDEEKCYQKLSNIFQSFWSIDEFVLKLKEIRKHSTTIENFRKRFFQWFEGFKVLKFVHHARDHGHPNVDVEIAVDWILHKYHQRTNNLELKEKLLLLREIDRKEMSI